MRSQITLPDSTLNEWSIRPLNNNPEADHAIQEHGMCADDIYLSALQPSSSYCSCRFSRELSHRTYLKIWLTKIHIRD